MRIPGLPHDLVACDRCKKLVHISAATRDGLAHVCDRCLQDFRASLEPGITILFEESNVSTATPSESNRSD